MHHIAIAPDRATLVLEGNQGTHPIHPIWLRERARHPEALDARTEQRLFNPNDLDPDLSVTAIESPAPGQFDLSFSDGLSCRFTEADLLRELHGIAGTYLPTPRPWKRDNAEPETFAWPDCGDEAVQLALLTTYLTHGYVLIDSVPSTHGAVLEVGRRFGFPRDTNFGVMFDVRSEPVAIDLAYTSLSLDPHTDNPYRHPVPGIQLLHCLINGTEGGLSTLVDGLAVSEALRVEHPDAYRRLTTTMVGFRYIDTGTELVARAPLIELDPAGTFAAINYSPRLDLPPLLPPDELSAFYAARRLLDRMLRGEEFERRFRLMDGQLMMFDNRRLLHGRTGFDPSTGHRHLQGCYIDSDGPRSQYRVLHRRLG